MAQHSHVSPSKLAPDIINLEYDMMMQWQNGLSSSRLHSTVEFTTAICIRQAALCQQAFPDSGITCQAIDISSVYNATDDIDHTLRASLGMKTGFNDFLRHCRGVDVLGLPVSYNGHTSLVVVKEPFAANTSSSCILYMDSIAGEIYHQSSHVCAVTQRVLQDIRQQLGLSVKALPTRKVVVPEQIEGSNACGYHTAYNYGYIVHDILKTKSMERYTYKGRELHLDYSPVAPLLLAQYAKDHVLVPQLSRDDPRRASLSSVCLVDLDQLDPPFDLLTSYAPHAKAQHDAIVDCLPSVYRPTAHTVRTRRYSHVPSSTQQQRDDRAEQVMTMLVQPTDAPDLDAIMAAQQPAAAPAAAAAAAASSVADAAPARPSQGYMPPPPARAAKQRRQQSQLAQQAPPPSSQEQQQQQQGKGRKRHIDEDDDDELEEQGCDVEQDSDDGVTADKPDPVARLNAAIKKSNAAAAKKAKVDTGDEGSSIAAAVIRLDQRVMSLDNTVKALTTTVMENTEAHKAVKETISGNSDAEIREALLATTAMQPLHKSLCVIFMEVQYCFLMHLHGAILKYLNRANKAEVAAMFRSKEKGAKFWEVILAKARSHFTHDVRAKVDNVTRGAIIWRYGSVPHAAPAAAAAAAPQRNAGVSLLGPESQPSQEDAGAAPAKGAEASSSAAAERQEADRLKILRCQAKAAKYGLKYARASEVFDPPTLQALLQDDALTGAYYENECFGDVVEDVLTYLYKRSGKQNNNPLGTMRVSTNLLGYIHSVVLRYFHALEGTTGCRDHLVGTNVDFTSRWLTCVNAVNAVYEHTEFKLRDRFDVYRVDDATAAAEFREAGSKAAVAEKLPAAAMNALLRRI